MSRSEARSIEGDELVQVMGGGLTEFRKAFHRVTATAAGATIGLGAGLIGGPVSAGAAAACAVAGGARGDAAAIPAALGMMPKYGGLAPILVCGALGSE
jgi:hypothetical protein